MRVRFCWFAFFLAVSFSGYSQNIAGSVYSVFGVGDFQERSSSYTRSMGYTSIGIRNDGNLNAGNPASLTSIAAPVTSMFEIGAYYGTTNFSNSATSNSIKAGGLQGINYWFRLSKKWASLLGVSPYSTTSYSVLASRVLGGATQLPTPVQSVGSGGINQFYFGNGFDITKHLTLGVTISYYLGAIKKRDVVPITNVSTPFNAETNIYASGGNYDFGLQYTFDIKKTRLVLGAVWDKGASLSGSSQVAFVNPTTFDTLAKDDRIYQRSRLAATYGGGFSVIRGRSTLAFDLKYGEWSKVNFDQKLDYRNSVKYSGGYEFRGDYTSVNYLKTISLRAGFWYQQYPIVIRSTYLNTYGYTLGLALPIQNNRATVALNYSVTTLGTTSHGFVKETGNRLGLEIIFRDVWGVKRRME